MNIFTLFALVMQMPCMSVWVSEFARRIDNLMLLMMSIKCAVESTVWVLMEMVDGTYILVKYAWLINQRVKTPYTNSSTHQNRWRPNGFQSPVSIHDFFRSIDFDAAFLQFSPVFWYNSVNLIGNRKQFKKRRSKQIYELLFQTIFRFYFLLPYFVKRYVHLTFRTSNGITHACIHC